MPMMPSAQLARKNITVGGRLAQIQVLTLVIEVYKLTT